MSEHRRRIPTFFAAAALGIALLLALAGVTIAAIWHAKQCSTPPPPLTFFTPDGYRDELARATPFGQINVYNPDTMRESLKVARKHGARLQLDFSIILTHQRPRERQQQHWRKDGQARAKSFAPLSVNKVKDMSSDDELAQALAPYLPALQEYREHVAAIFLADEPYMHGISRAEMERAARTVRRILQENGLQHIKLGVVFSGAMFDPGFAAMVAQQADAYVAGVENYYDTVRASDEGRAWAAQFAKARLTTYDLAGNLYTGGGIPQGFDIIAYDLYTATLLLDALHTRTLDWFAQLDASGACRRFRGTDMPQLRTQLSFFQDGSVQPGGLERDRPLLGDIFACKAESMLHLLRKHMPPGSALQLWGEASANGFLEFDARTNIDAEQPDMLIAARVHDEVQRTLDFYDRHRSAFSAGIIFFVWEDTHDVSINLTILGARSLPGVSELVFDRIGKHLPPHSKLARCLRR